MLLMNESRPSEKSVELILIASMPDTNKPAASIRVIERLNLEKSEDDFDGRLCERNELKKMRENEMPKYDRNTKRD